MPVVRRDRRAIQGCDDRTGGRRAAIADISIALQQSAGGVWRFAARGPDGTYALDESVGESILERASLRPRAHRLRLTIVVPPDELSRAVDAPGAIRTAIRNHFAHKREASEYALARTHRSGLAALAIGGVALVAIMSLVEGIHELAPAGRLATMLQEGLTIIAWVILWRPAELLLYDQWPIRSDIALFRRLECAEIRIVSEPRVGWSHPPAS